MDILILGMLMLKKLTIYEMRKHIEMNFTSMSSSSMGSIQAAIKKLLHHGMVRFDEYVENGVNKKMYEITDAGREYFLAAISKPMLHKRKRAWSLPSCSLWVWWRAASAPNCLRHTSRSLEKSLHFLMM